MMDSNGSQYRKGVLAADRYIVLLTKLQLFDMLSFPKVMEVIDYVTRQEAHIQRSDRNSGEPSSKPDNRWTASIRLEAAFNRVKRLGK
jgi:hypothetical protein